MTPNDYQQAALRTAPGDLPPEKLLLNGLMGLNGEAGEAIDILKKHLFQGHELDTAHMAKELGDVAWYLAVRLQNGFQVLTLMVILSWSSPVTLVKARSRLLPLLL